MQNFKLLVNNFISDESGQDLIEYALVAGLIALGAVVSMQSVSTAIVARFTAIAASINAA